LRFFRQVGDRITGDSACEPYLVCAGIIIQIAVTDNDAGYFGISTK
jgi:hypothetical protein